MEHVIDLFYDFKCAYICIIYMYYMCIHSKLWCSYRLYFSYILSYILILKSGVYIDKKTALFFDDKVYDKNLTKSLCVSGKGTCRLTLLHRSCPIPFPRNSERDRAVAPEVRKRNNNSLRGALSWGSGAQRLACQTCGIFPRI